MDREGLRPLTSKPAGMAVEHQQTRENKWIFPCPMPCREVNCGLSHRSPWRVPIWGGFGFGGAGSSCLAAPRYKWLFPGRLRFCSLWALLKGEGVDCPPPTPQPTCLLGIGTGGTEAGGCCDPHPQYPQVLPGATLKLPRVLPGGAGLPAVLLGASGCSYTPPGDPLGISGSCPMPSQKLSLVLPGASRFS